MKLLAILAFVLGSGSIIHSQDNVVGVLKAADNARGNSITPVSIVADKGDGTVVTITKRNTPKVNVVIQFTDNNGRIVTTSTSDTLSIAKDLTMKVGDVACYIFLNGTELDVNSGSLGIVPANALAYSCATNITSGGTTPPVVGLIRWP